MNNNSSIIIADTPEKIAAFRLLTLKSALRLECKGLKLSRGIRASVIVRETLLNAGRGAPSNKEKLLAAFVKYLTDIQVYIPPTVRA